MKFFFLFLLGFVFLSTTNAQLRMDEKMQTTSNHPEGVAFQLGKIIVLNSYRATYGPKDSKVVIIQKTSNLRMAGNGITGSFSCIYSEDNKPGDFTIRTGDNGLYCYGSCHYSLTVDIKPKAGIAITKAKGEWKKLVLC